MSKRKRNQIISILKSTKFDLNLIRFAYNLSRRLIYRCFPTRIDLPWPTTIMLELTNKCNLHCITCPREYEYGKSLVPGDMPLERAKEIIDKSYPYLQSIGLTGMGETLFAPHLLEVAKYVKSKKKSIVIFISTNANFPGFIEKIKPVLPFIDTIQISTDGVGSSYEDIRHGASFSMLDKHLTELLPLAQDHNVNLMFNMVINKRNYQSMNQVIKYAAEKGVKYVNFTYINLASITAVSTSYYDFFKTQPFLEAKKKAYAVAACHPEIEVTGLEPPAPGNGCPLLSNHFQINYDGEVPPCCAKPFTKEYSYGNVDGSSIKEVTNSPSAKRFRTSMQSGSIPDFCKKCHLLSL